MRRREQEQYNERSDFYILFVAGIYNLILTDVSLAGMPLRTLALLLADFCCIAFYVYKGKVTVPRWKECSLYERAMMALLLVSIVAVAVLVVFGSDHFWMAVDAIALLLVYPCIYGRKKFPQDLFCVYSICTSVVCILLLCYYLTGGKCELFIALLLQNNAVAPWLVLCVTMNMIAYCFQEKGQVWYGGNVIMGAFLLALQKNIPGMVIVGLVPLMLPVFCRPSKLLVKRAAQMGALYAFLVCNMSLIIGYTPLPEGIITYDLEISVYMELLLAAVGVWFFEYWDRYAEKADADTTIPELRDWCRRAITACVVVGVGVLTAAGLFAADEASGFQRMSQILIFDVKGNLESNAGLFEQMGQRFGMVGITVTCFWYYMNIIRIHKTKVWRIKAHKLYRLMMVVCLLQAVFLPQTTVTLPVYTVFFFLFMESEEKRTQKIALDDGVCKEGQNITEEAATEREEREKTDEAYHSDSMLQRGGDIGNRFKRSAKKAGRHRQDRISDHQ